MIRRLFGPRWFYPLVSVAALCIAQQALGGAWTMQKGGIYAKLSYGASSANNQLGFDGGTKPLVEGLSDYPFADRSFYLFGEYGLTDDLTLGIMVPFKRVFVHDNLHKFITTGVSDIALSGRYLVYNESGWVGSVSGSATIPAGYTRDFQPPLGAGQMDFAVAANVGRSLWPLPAYATASVGYRYRSTIYGTSRLNTDTTKVNMFYRDGVNFSDEIFYLAEGGYTFFNRLLVHVVISGVASTRATGSAFTITSVPTTQSYLKLGGGAAVGIADHYELSGDLFATARGTNTSKSVDIFLGVGVKF